MEENRPNNNKKRNKRNYNKHKQYTPPNQTQYPPNSYYYYYNPAPIYSHPPIDNYYNEYYYPYYIPPPPLPTDNLPAFFQEEGELPENINAIVNKYVNPSQYEEWKNNNVVSVVIPTCSPINKEEEEGEEEEKYDTTPIINKNIHIDEPITSIEDILRVVEKYPYNPQTQYNIQLKVLHDIAPELRRFSTMVGMENVKRSVFQQIIYFLQMKGYDEEHTEYKHTVLYGPPGTGKTETALLMGTIFSKMGLLKKGTFKKVSRNDLIAGFLGQTAIKTKKVIEEALGGVLFIDEAYSLSPNSSSDSDMFAKECIDTLCEALSENKGNLMVIIAGYEEEIKNTIFRMNQGLESRFIWKFHIEPYKATELQQIFSKKVGEAKWTFYTEGLVGVEWFQKRNKEFGYYGRDMEILFTFVKIRHSIRTFGLPTENQRKITMDDMENGYELFLKNKYTKKRESEYMNSIYI